MAQIFLLGPGHWNNPSQPPMSQTPLDVRRKLLKIFRQGGHDAFIMEDQRDIEGEDIVDRFYRILIERRTTDVVVYWPTHAKMQTTHDELVLLRSRHAFGTVPALWLLHDEAAASVAKGELKVNESPRSRYLEAVARLGVRSVPWTGQKGLYEAARWLVEEI